MPFQVTVRRLPDFTSVTVTGTASLDAFVALITGMAQETRHHGDRRVLVDLLGVQGELKFTDHFQMGTQAAQHLHHLDKLASVVPPERITHTSEKVAARQGLQLRVFTSRAEAVEWLTARGESRGAVAHGSEQA